MADDDYTAGLAGSDGEATPADLDGLSRRLIGWVKKDMPQVAKWRKEAREDLDFYAGNQWSDDDLQELRSNRRPALSFNRIAPLVNAVTGSEINNRREVRYIPREAGDAEANEVLSAAAEWFRDECAAEDEESDAFQDTVVTGMGWTDTRLDFEEDPDGAPKIERIDPLEMGWDCYASKPNLEDAKRLWRVREISYDEAVELTGERDRSKLHAEWIKNLDTEGNQHDQTEADLYNGGQDEFAEGYGEKKCCVVEIRWLEKQEYYRGPDMMNPGEVREYDARQIDLIRKETPDFPAIRQFRKVVRRAFVGREVLGQPDRPFVPVGLFGWECITGYRDKVNNQFYGIVRAAKDPQRWSNKFFSQVMYLLNSQSKGGIIAERGAFEDDRQAETSWARSDSITWAKQGALSSDKPKIVPKSPAQFPAGFFTLFQESKESISDVTGLSEEFLGTREVEQAGVLEYQRRQSSLNILASLFNGLRRYRKRQGRVMLYLIQEHLSDGRLIRIVGDGLSRYVPLTKEQVANVKYDIIVDDSPSSPNEKERTWQILMQMLPMVKDMMTPEIGLELLKLSPLPASLVNDLQRKAQAAAQQPKPPSPEEIKAQGELQKFRLDMAGKQADLQADQQKNQMDVQSKAIDLMMDQRKAEIEMAIERQKLQNDVAKLAIQAEQNEVARQNANSRRVSAAKQ